MKNLWISLLYQSLSIIIKEVVSMILKKLLIMPNIFVSICSFFGYLLDYVYKIIYFNIYYNKTYNKRINISEKNNKKI